MLRLNLVVAGLIVLSAGLLTGQSAGSTVPPHGVTEPSSTSLVLELDRAILVLKRGIKERWETRAQYLAAFENTTNADASTDTEAKAKEYVECALSARLRIHQVWDEGSPIGVEAQRTIIELTKWREEAAAQRPLPPCPESLPRRVRVSAGVAAGMLKTRVKPVYPGDVRISGTIVLNAVIGATGRVESLNVVSGPVMLQQSALEAVRQWTFQPYLLNGMPVEVETTINVVFAPGH